MIYGYIRTSTDKQNNENQRFEIEQFANNNNLTINQWIEETISSRKSLDERKLGKLLKKIKQDDIIIANGTLTIRSQPFTSDVHSSSLYEYRLSGLDIKR